VLVGNIVGEEGCNPLIEAYFGDACSEEVMVK